MYACWREKRKWWYYIITYVIKRLRGDENDEDEHVNDDAAHMQIDEHEWKRSCEYATGEKYQDEHICILMNTYAYSMKTRSRGHLHTLLNILNFCTHLGICNQINSIGY